MELVTSKGRILNVEVIQHDVCLPAAGGGEESKCQPCKTYKCQKQTGGLVLDAHDTGKSPDKVFNTTQLINIFKSRSEC